jgi:transcriptional regulator with XRE-family HTH domain
MNDVGKLIEARRKKVGLSRDQLAERLGVTAQTVLNLERDAGYNLGTRLLRRIEDVLGVEFTVEMKEKHRMSDTIRMGNDEFLLYVRKTGSTALNNAQLGKKIWAWLEANADGQKLALDQPCLWGAQGDNVGEDRLPATAAQFEFKRSSLPALFTFLDELARS